MQVLFVLAMAWMPPDGPILVSSLVHGCIDKMMDFQIDGLNNGPTNKLNTTVILGSFDLSSWIPKAFKIDQENH